MITDTHSVLVATWPQQTLGFTFSLPHSHGRPRDGAVQSQL